jgi:NTE family protein
VRLRIPVVGTCAGRAASEARVPANRALYRYKEMQSFQDSASRPYIHLVDGGTRGQSRAFAACSKSWKRSRTRASHGRRTRLDGVRRLVIFVVNSLSAPEDRLGQVAAPPNDLMILLKADRACPIDRYSYEAIDLLADISVRWKMLRGHGQRAAVPDVDVYASTCRSPRCATATKPPTSTTCATSFALTPEAVDRLRAAGRDARARIARLRATDPRPSGAAKSP